MRDYASNRSEVKRRAPPTPLPNGLLLRFSYHYFILASPLALRWSRVARISRGQRWDSSNILKMPIADVTLLRRGASELGTCIVHVTQLLHCRGSSVDFGSSIYRLRRYTTLRV